MRQKGKWVGVPWPNVAEMDELELFLLCFPVKYLKEVVIPQTNKHLTKYLSMQELFVFIGCILFMACHPGVKETRCVVVEQADLGKRGCSFSPERFHVQKSIQGDYAGTSIDGSASAPVCPQVDVCSPQADSIWERVSHHL